MERNLTTGSVFKNIVIFSLPYFLSYFLQTLYGLADLFIIGQYEGVASTTAVSVGSQVMHMLTVMIVGLAMGTTVSIGRAVGAGDKKRVSACVGNTITLFMLVSIVLTAVLVPLCTFATVRILSQMIYTVGTPKTAAIGKTKDMAVVDSLDAYAQEKMGDAQSVLAGLNTSDFTLPTQPETEPPHEHYTIPADAAAAPKPNQSLYGSVRKPEDMEPVLEQAKWVLDGQKTYFQLDQQIYDDSLIRYYLDETILAVTWQEVHDDSVYTFSEIKVEDASQFRRHLAGGEYGSNIQYLTTEMAETVNAVVASAGDFYRFRDFGAVVYQGQAKRVEGTYAETCYIDFSGDMHFTRAGEVLTTQAVQQYVDENNINFSLAFGPILVDNYQLQEHSWYGVGEINEGYARSALCQMDSLHYLVVRQYHRRPPDHPHGCHVRQEHCRHRLPDGLLPGRRADRYHRYE